MIPEHQEFQTIFDQLKTLLPAAGQNLVITKDTKQQYDLYYTKKFRGKDLYFGGVAIKKNYVSLYLMAIYGMPKLVADLPPSLRQRMQGKACFNFIKLEQVDALALKNLIHDSTEKFKKFASNPLTFSG